MSRSGYVDDLPNSQEEQWAQIRYMGQLKSAIRGKRGQIFLRELRDALDAMPVKRLIAGELIRSGEVCAIGALGVQRGIALEKLDPEYPEQIAKAFGIAHQLVREIEFMNDEGNPWQNSPESRWCRMHAWVSRQIKQEATLAPEPQP